MTNENVLKGMACPVCQSEGPFEIAMDCVFLVSDDGTEDQLGDNTWDNDSYCGCRECSHSATVEDFQIGGSSNASNLY